MEMYFVITVTDRYRAKFLMNLFKELDIPLTTVSHAHGTATQKILALNGLEQTEKAVVACVVDGEKRKQVFRAAKKKLYIDVPGHGIMMAVPIKSIGGGRTLAFLTGGGSPDQAGTPGEFTHELICIVLNQGFTDDVMKAARDAGAGGGTVIHAKGTGKKYAEKFFGVTLAEEKELVLIAAKQEERTAIMQAVASEAGIDSPAGAIAFSLPVTKVIGMRQTEEEEA